MAGQPSPLFQTYLRNLQRIYWVEFIESQTELLNARSAALAGEANGATDVHSARACLSSTYDYFRYRR